MKRFSPALFGLAACAISLFTIGNFTVAPHQVAAQSNKNAQARKNADIERELVRMEEEANELFMKREFAKLAEGWMDNVVFILLDGKIVEGRAAAQQGMQDSKERYDSLKISENKLYLHGDVAMLTYLLTATGPVGFQARYTDVLVKQNGKWKLVHSQGTIVQGTLRFQSKQQN